MKKTIYKFAAVLVVIPMFYSVFSVGKSYAYFSDTATISGTTFTAGTLGFSLSPSTDFVSSALLKGGTASYSTTLVNDGTLGFQYTASTTITGGDSDLCNYLNLQASLNSNPISVYDGPLSGFLTTAQNYDDLSVWDFVVTLPSGAIDALQDKTCNFKIAFDGWQENLLSTQGFSDTEQINGSITSGHWAVPVNSSVVLNEILPNPEGDDGQHGLQGEWVELYNNGNTSVDLAGWMIKDLAGNTKTISSINTFNGRTIIGPKGSGLEWVVVFMNDAILNNGGDTVYLKDQANNTIDHYAYGNSGNDDDSDSNSTGGGSNSNPSGSETSGNEGKSYARIPDGTGDWVDPIPTPGEPNKVEETVIETPVVPDQTLSGSPSTSSGSSSGVVTNMEMANTTPAAIESQPSPEASAGEDESATATASEGQETTGDLNTDEIPPATETEQVEAPVAPEPAPEPDLQLEPGKTEPPVVESIPPEQVPVEVPTPEAPIAE